MAIVRRFLLIVAATACSSLGAACGSRSSLDLSWGEDAATADVSVPPLGKDGALDSAVTSDASAPTETPPSCQAGGPGLTNCGAVSESCCTSLEVTGETYYRTYANDGGGPTDEADPATVSGFRLDKYLVTVERFRQYVNYVTSSIGAPPANGSGKHTHLNGGLGLANSASIGTYETGWDATDWDTYITTGASAESSWNMNLACPIANWTDTAGPPNLPINCVNWFEAYAFCTWDGGFLPSEAEWEYVAAGGNQQREYPWGSTDPGAVNQYVIEGCLYFYHGSCSMAPVGTATDGAGLWGQLDMVGEVEEWNLDWYASYIDPCTNCAYFSPSAARVTRGGNVGNYMPHLLPPDRGNDVDPTVRDQAIGFRCARTP